MPTFQVIQDRVARRIIDLPTAVTAEVPDLINKAMRKLQKLHNFKVMEAETGQLTTTVATRPLSAAVPTEMKELRGLPYLVKDDGSTRDLLVAANRAAVLDVFSLSDASDTGEPKLLLDPEPEDDQNTRTWEVYPFPDGNSDWSGGEYRVVIPYWKYVTALDDGADGNWFTSNAEWWLTFLATAEGFYLDWDEARGQMWETRAQGELAEVVKTDKIARLGSVRQLSIHLGVWDPQIRS